MSPAPPRSLIVLLLAATGCGSSTSFAAPSAPGCTLVESGHGPAGQVPIRAERVAEGLEVPWGLAFLPGGDVLVTERPGRVRLISGGQLVAEPVATLPVAATGEGGLLGIAADPGFAENRRLYVYYTADAAGRRVNRVARYLLATDGRSAAEDRVLLDDIPGASFHDGGRIRFGPDGMLYVGTGDAGVPASAQDVTGVSGKILRITTDGAPAPGNPLGDSPAYVLGIRNTQAFGWLDDGTLVVGDHGPSGEFGRVGHDEVTVARAGANLGWPDVYACEEKQGTEAPVLVFAEATPPGGGSVYRGSAIPEWQGSFLFGTLRSRHLHRVAVGTDGKLQLHEVYLAGEPPAGLGRVREALEGPDGALWVTTSNCDGRGTCPAEKDVVVRIVRGG